VIPVVGVFILRKITTVVTDLTMERDVATMTHAGVVMIVIHTTVVSGIVMTDAEVITQIEKIDTAAIETETGAIGTEMTDAVNAVTEIDIAIAIVEEEEKGITMTDEEGPAEMLGEMSGMPIGRSKRVVCLWHMPFRTFKRKVPDTCAKKPKNGLQNVVEEPCNCRRHLILSVL